MKLRTICLIVFFVLFLTTVSSPAAANQDHIRDWIEITKLALTTASLVAGGVGYALAAGIIGFTVDLMA